MNCVFTRPGSVIVEYNVKSSSKNLELASVNMELVRNLTEDGYKLNNESISQSGKF